MTTTPTQPDVSGAPVTARAFDHHRGAKPLLRPTASWRLALLMAMNLTAFVAVNLFWQYLSTGQWPVFDISLSAYRRDLGVGLGEMLDHPLDIFSHPWMILVIGLLLGVIIFMPVIVSVLYRLVYAAVFVTVVGVLGHAPVLALTLMIGCLLAARTRLRSNRPFLAVLLGIAPVVVYLYLFSFEGMDSAALPIQQWVRYAPFMLAVLAAIVASVIVLTLARLLKYRPGVVWPVLLVLVAASPAVFFWKITPAELQYALIADRLAPGDAIFEPVPVEAWSRGSSAHGLDNRGLEQSADEDLRRRSKDLDTRCQRFLDRHETSDRAPAVLWIQAQCRSLQLDRVAFAAGLLKYTASYPAPQEESAAGVGDAWSRLANQYPSAPQAALAQWRLGELAVRHGDVAGGRRMLEKARGQLTAIMASQDAEQARRGHVFVQASSVPADAYYGEALLAVGKLLWLMDSMHVGADQQAAEAFTAWINLNPRAVEYRRQLQQLAERCAKTEMGPYLELSAALAGTDPDERAGVLTKLASGKNTAASVEANYELGRMALQPAQPRNLTLRPPQAYFQQVVDAPPNPWTDVAKERLQRLKWLATTRPNGNT